MATYTSNYAWAKPSGSDPVDISVLNGNLDSQDGIIHDAFLNMAAPFSESSTYAVGDIVLYGTKTYRCRVAVTTAGSWTGAINWDEYKLSEGGLVAGDYINIQNGVVNVQTEIGTYDYVRYELESTGGGDIKLIVRKYVNNVLDSTTEYPNDGQHHEIDDVMDTWYEYGPYLWHYKLLVASTDHAVGYEESWSYQDTSVHTVNFQFAQDDSTTLVTKGDLDDALDDKVDKVTGKGLSTNDYTNTDKAEVAKVANKADKTATATGETLSLVPTSEGRALIHTAYGMSTQSGTPTPSSPADIVSAKANFTSTHGQDSATVTTDLTLRAIEVSSSDAYNLVRDGKYYIADTLDYDEDNGWSVTRRIKESVIDGSQSITTSRDGQTMTVNNLYTTSECISFLSPNNRFKAIDGNSTNLADANSKLSNGECIKRNTKQSIAASDYFKNTSMTSASDWATWLTSNPITIYDILATPTTETITTTQALALLGLKTYDGSTTISSQAEPSCTIAVEYAQERLGALALTAYNTAKGNDLRITALEG